MPFRAGEYSRNLRRILQAKRDLGERLQTRHPVETPTYQLALGSLPCCSFRNILNPLLTQGVGEWRPVNEPSLQLGLGRGLKAEGTGGSESLP